MKRKHFILALVAMLWSVSLSTFAQETVVVNSFEELKAEIGKRVKGTRANAARSAANVTTDWTDTEFGTVKLGNDIVLSETLEVGNTYELTLDLNGHTISPAQGTNNYFINLGSTTIHDDSDAQTGTINCAIQNGNETIDYAYLEIQGGTVKSLDATGAAITNYAECVISGGKFFSEHTGLTNYNTMTVDGGADSNVYIEGKTYSIKNSSALTVKNAVIAGTEDSYLAEGDNADGTFDNVTYYQVALNGQGYASLQEAVNDAVDGDLIRLFGNITETATVSINKAITLDGNGKSLANAIKVSETTGNVSITDLAVTTDSEYALQVESSATVNVTDSKLSGTGAVKSDAGKVIIKDTDLSGSNADVISVASNVIVNLNGGSIKASDANNAFIIGGTEGCTGAQLSIMTTEITLGSVKNYINLNTDNNPNTGEPYNTVKLHKTFETDLYNKGYVTDAKGIALTVYNAVATVNHKNYRTLAAALDAATLNSVVTLLWADYKAPISMAGTVAGDKTVTITGTAQVDWSKGWLYVGRNATGNGKVTFSNANLTSVSNSTSHGINVSGSKKDSDTTNDGVVELVNSTIVLDYLINKGAMSLYNSTLTVKNGFATGGRPASETESGVDATATMTLNEGSKLVVNNHNGQGLGYEAIGVMNVNSGSTFETTQAFLVTEKGTMNVNDGTVKIVGTLTNNGIVYATGAANLEAKVTGAGWFYMNGVSLNADTKLDGAKVAFINGTNNVVGSTIKNGFFNVGVGQNDAATAAATFASANGITLGDVTVNVSENAVVDGNGESYSGWVGSAYSAEKTLHTYTLNITNSLATFGYMHVSKDGAITVDGRSADNNKYTYDNANVNFYAGDFIINGKVTFNNADAWAKFTKMSVDHADGVLNINGNTKFESSIHNGGNTGVSLKFWKAGQVNVEKDATVEVDNQTVLVEGAELNIAGNVTAKGAVTGNGTITLTDAAAVYTAPADLTVGTTVDNKVVVYENGAYLLKDAVAKIGDVCYLAFAEAMGAANAMTGEVTVEVLAAVEFVDGMELNGNYTTINFVGQNDEAKMTINQTAGGDYLEAHGKNVNFTDLTLAKANPQWSANSAHMGNYFSVQGGTATYTNCIFLNGACTSGGTATYTDCTFQNESEYGLWAYDDAIVTVNGGTFDSKKGIKVYSEDETSVTTTLTVENATFTENVTAKPAVAVGYAASVTLKGNTYNNPTAHIELDSGSDADCEGVTFVAQDADGNDISATLEMTDRSNNNADCGVLVDGKVYTTVTTAVQDAKDGSNVTILYSTEEAAEFVPGVTINLADGVTADNVVVADRLNDYVVLPNGVDESNFVFKFGDNTVTDGTNYYATLQAAVEAVNGQANAVLYCKPGANVGSLQHAPVTSTLTVYGNGANVTGDTERDFDLGNTDPSGGKDITADMTLTVKRLNGCGAWGTKATEHTVNLVFENCANMGKVFIYGTTGTLNITMTDCAFEGVIKEAVYSNADGAITLTNVAFSNLDKAVNLNHKAAGTQTVTINGCTFTNCGADVATDQIPVRVLSSVAGAKSVLTVNSSTFAGTPDGGADILLDYNAIGLTYATITNTTANVKPENEVGNAEMVAVTEADVYEYCNADVQVGDTKYRTFGEAVAAVKNGGTITLLNDITATDDHIFVQAPNVQVTIEGNNKTFAGTITVDGKSAAYATAGLTIKNVKFIAATDAVCINLGVSGDNNTRYTSNVTVEGCTFTGTDNTAVGIKSYTGGDKNLTVTNCTATKMHSLMQLKNVAGVKVANCKVVEGKNGISLGVSSDVAITSTKMDCEGYGVRADGGASVVVTNSEIDAFIPVVVRNASAETFLTFNGDNTMTASNTDEVWCAIGTSEYETNNELPTPATGKVRVTLNDEGLDEEGVYGNFVPVAMIGTEDYSSLQDAVNAVKNGETIMLIENIEDTVDINKSNVAFTIDGAISETENAKFNGKIQINIGQNVTVKNVDFVWTDDAAHDFIANVGSPTGKNYNTTLLVEDCSFTGNGKENVVAVRTIHPTSVVIKDCTATGLHSFLQNTGGQSISVEGLTLTNSKGGLAIGSPNNIATVKNCNLTTSTYGIRLDAVTAGTGATLENNVVNAYIPVSVRKATAANYDLSFSGEQSSYTATNGDDVWCAICTTEYEPGVALNPATGNVSVELNDSGLPLDGIYGNFGVASIGKATYLTFEAALDAVQDGETITLTGGESNSELETEIEFSKDIEFTITGNAPKYALPTVTFLNADVTIKDAKILIPELDARQNAVIDVKNSIVHDAGGNGIVKSYFNGAINIDANSTVYTMQVTTMGYINVAGTLNATWQTNVYGNGMITVSSGATFNTAALHLTAQDYSGRDNTDADRVGKPATIIVDGATFTAGKVYSDNGADYSYNADDYGLNVGTIDGKSALFDIKNGANVNIYAGNGKTVNFGAGATVNVDASTLNVLCRGEGAVTLANNGTVNVSGASNLAAANVTGDGWFYMNGVSLDADTKLLGANVRFASGTNTVDGATIDDGMFQVGVGAYNGVDANVDTENGVVVNVKNNAKIGSKDVAYGGWIGTGFYDTDDEKATVMTDAEYVLNIDNSIAEFGYLHVSNDGELNVNGVPAEKAHYNNSEYAFYAGDFIINGTANFTNTDVLAIYTKVSCDNGTTTPGTLNINAGTEYEAERHNGAVSTDSNFTLYKTGVVNVAEGANLQACEASSIAENATLNIAGSVTAFGTVANNGAINFTSLAAKLVTPTEGVTIKHAFADNYKIVYKDGAYSFGDFVAEINGVYYDDIKTALQALTEGATLEFLNDVTVTEAWTPAIAVSNVTIDGNGKTLTLTSADAEQVFRVTGNGAKFMNLKVDVSAAQNLKKGISAQLDITVENCTFTGNGTTSEYGIIYGEGAGTAISTVAVSVTGSNFSGFTYGVSDNGQEQDAKSVTVTGNTFTNAKVLLSAAENVTFSGNEVNGASVAITSHNRASEVYVTAKENTLDAAQANQITTNPGRVDAQAEFAKAVATNNNVYYLTLPAAIEAVAADAEITMLTNVTGAGAVINKNVTINFNGNTYTFNEGVGSTGTESNGFQILKDNTVTLKNGTLNVDAAAASEFYTVIQNYADLTVENMTLDGTYLDKWALTDGDSYVLSINSGNVFVKGNTNITANNDGDKAFAFDACDKTANGYTLPVVTVETSGTIEGLIESTATIVIKNGTYTMDVTQWCAEGVTAEPVEVDGKLVYTIVRGITIIDGQLTEFTNDQNKENCYIRYERTFTNVNKWQALYVPFEIPVETLKDLGYEVAYLYDVHNKVVAGEEIDPAAIESIHFVKITKGTLRANYPYIIRPTATADLKLVLEFNNATLFSTTKDDMNSVESSTTTTRYIFAGTYKRANPATLTGGDAIPCFAFRPEGYWQQMPATANLGAFRIFMYIVNKDNSPVIISDEAAKSIQIRIIGEENEDGTTTIYDMEYDEQTVDYIYDLQGRRVLEPQKGGLYIVNGKKVIF